MQDECNEENYSLYNWGGLSDGSDLVAEEIG